MFMIEYIDELNGSFFVMWLNWVFIFEWYTEELVMTALFSMVVYVKAVNIKLRGKMNLEISTHGGNPSPILTFLLKTVLWQLMRLKK